MFATRVSASWTTKVCLLLLVAVLLASGPAAEAASPSNHGWQAAGSTASSSSAAVGPSAPSTAWRLPKGQADPADHSEDETSNPLRQKNTAPTPLREPRTMPAPVNAQPLASIQTSTNTKRTGTAQSHSPSAAVAQTAAVIPNNKPTATTPRPSLNQRTATPRTARTSPVMRGTSNPHAARTWQRMNIARQDADAWVGEAEDLPMPGTTGHPGNTMRADPFGPDPQGYYLDGDAQYPSCGPDGCGDRCGCGDGVYEPGCGDGCCGCDGECCNDCFCIGPGDPESCHSVRIRVPKWQELNFFAGVQGFKGPYDQDRDSGNFGFHEGFNSGFKIPYTFAGYQIGYQAAQSQLNGDEASDDDESHTQHFTTFGLFRRVDDGLQFGTAWDVLVDQRFHARTFHQLRSEMSWMDCGSHEFGVSATVGLNQVELDDEEEEDEEIVWQAADQYVLFYRFHGSGGGEGRIYGGWTDDSDGILGADLLLPIQDRWSVQTGFNYIIPDASNGEDGASEEAWNISLAMVWHWGCSARSSHDNQYRPLFNVANNGYLVVDSREED